MIFTLLSTVISFSPTFVKYISRFSAIFTTLFNFQSKIHPRFNHGGFYSENFQGGNYFEKNLYYKCLPVVAHRRAKHMSKHLTLQERIDIASSLNKQESFKSIGAMLSKDCTTISKEIRNHRIFKRTGARGGLPHNACRHRFHCDKRHICKTCTRTGKRVMCWSCQHCNKNCPDFSEERCSLLNRPPYVCNGCQKLPTCTLQKAFYQADAAHQEYRDVLSEARQGLSLEPREIEHIDSIISPLIRKGQSIHHICVSFTKKILISFTGAGQCNLQHTNHLIYNI